VLGMPKQEGELVNRVTYDFVDEVSRDSPAPGGGSVAALAGALGAALGTMVANLSATKGTQAANHDALAGIAERGQAVKEALVAGVDADTSAFDGVIAAMRMPKDSDEQRTTRDAALETGYRAATAVPLATVGQCRDALAVRDGAADGRGNGERRRLRRAIGARWRPRSGIQRAHQPEGNPRRDVLHRDRRGARGAAGRV